MGKVLTSTEQIALNILKSRNHAPNGWWSLHADTSDAELQAALGTMSAKLVVKGKMQVEEAKRWLPKLGALLSAKTEKWRETLELIQQEGATLKSIANVEDEVLKTEKLDVVVKAVPGRVAKVKEKIKRYRDLRDKISSEVDTWRKFKWSPEALDDLSEIQESCKKLLQVLSAVERELNKVKSHV